MLFFPAGYEALQAVVVITKMLLINSLSLRLDVKDNEGAKPN